MIRREFLRGSVAVATATAPARRALRLRRLDPKNLFHLNANIKPKAAVG